MREGKRGDEALLKFQFVIFALINTYLLWGNVQEQQQAERKQRETRENKVEEAQKKAQLSRG